MSRIGLEIKNKQDCEENLQLLAAQRQLYSEAKLYLGWQIILGTLFTIALNILILIVPDWKIISIIWATLMLALDVLYFSKKQKEKKEMAARIQEEFAMNVLDIPWNELKGEKIESTHIIETTERCDKTKFPPLTNWYTVSDTTKEFSVVRIECQQQDIRWDKDLREKYHKCITACLWVVLAIIILPGLIADMSFRNVFLYEIALAQPLLAILAREYLTHSEASKRLVRLNSYANKLKESATHGKYSLEELLVQSRRLQDEIYEHRKNAPLIWDWFFNKLKERFEKLAKHSSNK